MTPLEQQRGLRVGLNLEAVRKTLHGWHDYPVIVTESMDRKSHTVIWDFAPPSTSDARPLRLTLVNGALVVWGTPADERTAQIIAAMNNQKAG